MDNNSSRRQLKKLWDVLEVIRNWKSCNQNKEKIWDKITRIETIADGSINPERVGYFFLSDDDKIKFSIKEGDILFSHINSPVHIWKVAISTKNYDDLFHGMNLLLLRGNKKLLDPFFLFNLLNWFFVRWDWELMCKKAINQASLNQKNILEKIIPLPPLEEQKKIVAYLDELNVTISKLKSEYQSQLAMLDEMRNSSLDLAFWGSREREGNLNNWKWVKLWEVCDFQNWYAFKSDLFKSSGLPILRISNIQKNWISNENLVFFHQGDYAKDFKDFCVYPWDLVIAMSGATTWKLALNNTDTVYYLNQRVWKFIFKHEITKLYCHLFLNTKIIDNLNQSAGSAIPNLSTAQINNIEIPLPDLETQAKIVAHLDQIHQHITSLKAQITQQIQHCDELWKSSLDKVLTQGVE